MEFSAAIIVPASAADLQRRLTISALPYWCSSIEKVLNDAGSSGEIYCVWGAFDIHREELRSGVRFSLPGCPHAFQWTVTTGHRPNLEQSLVHLTISGAKHDQDFIDSIQQFVADWKAGLEKHW